MTTINMGEFGRELLGGPLEIDWRDEPAHTKGCDHVCDAAGRASRGMIAVVCQKCGMRASLWMDLPPRPGFDFVRLFPSPHEYVI